MVFSNKGERMIHTESEQMVEEVVIACFVVLAHFLGQTEKNNNS